MDMPYTTFCLTQSLQRHCTQDQTHHHVRILLGKRASLLRLNCKCNSMKISIFLGEEEAHKKRLHLTGSVLYLSYPFKKIQWGYQHPKGTN
jgi:hypothetical protein